MSARTHTGLLGRALAVAGAGAMVFTASVAMAPTASADEYGPGHGPETGHEDGVLSIQELLMWKHDADIANDGRYGEETFWAVCDAQEAYGLDVDGHVGRLTWRALITDQEWEQEAARKLPQAQVSQQAPEGFVADPEEAAAQYSCDDRPA